jgi:hypothetical protein
MGHEAFHQFICDEIAQASAFSSKFHFEESICEVLVDFFNPSVATLPKVFR